MTSFLMESAPPLLVAFYCFWFPLSHTYQKGSIHFLYGHSFGFLDLRVVGKHGFSVGPAKSETLFAEGSTATNPHPCQAKPERQGAGSGQPLGAFGPKGKPAQRPPQPPRVPFYPSVGEGSILVELTTEEKGTLILTSLLEDLAKGPCLMPG